MTTINLRLTSLRESDSALMYDWINDRNEVLHNAAFRPISDKAHQAWFDAVHSRSDLAIFGIRLDTDELIGTGQLHSISQIHRSAELQIRIGKKEARGLGYGAKATQLLIDFGFDDLNLNKIYLYVFATNSRAINLYEKAGFRREGILRKHAHIGGEYVDIIPMGLLRDEYLK